MRGALTIMKYMYPSICTMKNILIALTKNKFNPQNLSDVQFN